MGIKAEPVRSGRFTLRQPRVRLFDREAPLGYILLAPTGLILLVFLAYPFFYGLYLSITSAEVDDPGHFVGTANYVFEGLRDHVFQAAFVNTFIYTGVTTVLKLVLGLVMALLLNQAFPARRFVRAALLLPYIIPTVLSTLAWRWMFDPTFSVLNWVASHGLGLPRVNWLGTPLTAMISLIIVNTWRGMPFYGISFLAGMQTIPVDLYEAAKVDGANKWQQFRTITLPLLRPILLVVLMLSTILTFADFQLPYVLTRGAPYNSSHLLATWAYTIAIPGGQIGVGAAVSLFLFPVLMIVIAGVLLLLRRPE